MKILIFNTGADVGKSFVSRELFSSRFDKCHILEIDESLSGNGKFKDIFSSFSIYVSEEFFSVINDMLVEKNIVVDVGARCMSGFIDESKKYPIIFTLFDMIIVPFIPEHSLLPSTMNTLSVLEWFYLNTPLKDFDEFPPVYLLGNMICRDLESDFEEKILNSISLSKMYIYYNQSLCIHKLEIYDFLYKNQKTVESLVKNNGRDYMKESLVETNREKRIKLANEAILQMQLAPIKKELDNVFNIIMADYERFRKAG